MNFKLKKQQTPEWLTVNFVNNLSLSFSNFFHYELFDEMKKKLFSTLIFFKYVEDLFFCFLKLHYLIKNI